MTAVFSFLEAKEVLFFQGVSKFMYHRGVERLQKRLKLRIQTQAILTYKQSGLAKKVFILDYPNNQSYQTREDEKI